jgi:hypothetical protein
MRHSSVHGQAVPAEAGSGFAGRPASQTWEQVFLPECPENYVWAWFKPAHLPHGLILRVPDESYRTHPQLVAQWTMRKLLRAARVEPALVAMWHLRGVPYPGLNGTTPYLDAPLPAPAPGMDPNIVVAVNPPQVINGAPVMPAPMSTVPMMPGPMITAPMVAGPPVMSVIPVHPAAMMAGMPLGPAVAMAQPAAAQPQEPVNPDVFERIDADWHSSLDLEKELGRLRKQLVDTMGRLKSLNRELNPPERLHTNSQDKKEWLEARRGLRDATTRLWKSIKAYDIGDTSYAGQRLWFEQTYAKYIVPQTPFDGLTRAERQFESHRKSMQMLHNEMSNAHNFATLEAERRAQQVMNRIQQKVREASSRKNFLGVILDS